MPGMSETRSGASALTIESISVADPPEAWAAAGFEVNGRTCRVGSIEVELAGREAGRGLLAMSVRGLSAAKPDGLPFEPAPAAPVPAPAATHPNGVVRIDHVVAFTPNRGRTVAALEAAGLVLRRLRDEPTPGGGGGQAFFRLGESILELVENPRPRSPDEPGRLWGLAFLVEDLDVTARVLGERLGEARPAVQPGRRIATLRRDAGLSFGCAFMTPGPEAA